MTGRPNTTLQSQLHGLWLPLITPFRDGALDEPSLRRLIGFSDRTYRHIEVTKILVLQLALGPALERPMGLIRGC